MARFGQISSAFPDANLLFDAASGGATARVRYNQLLADALRQRMDLEASDRAATAGAVQAMPWPGQEAAAAAPVGGFEGRLAAAEAPNAAAVNKQGYSGKFQFGAARLADLGLYKPAEGEDLSKNEWKGRFAIPGFAATNHAEFLASPAAQRAAFARHVTDIDEAIGKTPGADRMNRDGLRAVAHLGGISGMQRFVSSGGVYSPADANGTRLSDYYQRFSEGGTPALQQAFGDPGAGQQAAAVAPAGVAARTGGYDVAGPPVPPPGGQQAGAAMPAELHTGPLGLTYRDVAELTPMRAAIRTPAQLTAFQNEVQQRQSANYQRQQAWRTHQDALAQQAQTNRRADTAEQRAVGSDAREAERLQMAREEAGRKAADASGIHRGTEKDAQDLRVLETSDPSTREYQGAYDRMAAKRFFPDGSYVVPEMRAYDPPTFKRATTGGAESGMTRPAATPAELTKLKDVEVGAGTLLGALDTFQVAAKKASIGERLDTALGRPTALSTAWTNAGLLAKGDELYKLGVLTGPDYSLMQRALADPSTFWGAMASDETIDAQVKLIKDIINGGLRRRRELLGVSDGKKGEASTPAQAPSKVIQYDQSGKRVVK